MANPAPGPGSGRLRRTLNWINLSTPVGLLVARASGSRITRTPDGYRFATGYRWKVPVAAAFTIGDVVLTRGAPTDPEDPWSPLLPEVWQHELAHAEQYMWCVGLPFVPLYFLACGYSYAMCGDIWSYNVFEARAGLAAGHYEAHARRPSIRHVATALTRGDRGERIRRNP